MHIYRIEKEGELKKIEDFFSKHELNFTELKKKYHFFAFDSLDPTIALYAKIKIIDDKTNFNKKTLSFGNFVGFKIPELNNIKLGLVDIIIGLAKHYNYSSLQMISFENMRFNPLSYFDSNTFETEVGIRKWMNSFYEHKNEIFDDAKEHTYCVWINNN